MFNLQQITNMKTTLALWFVFVFGIGHAQEPEKKTVHHLLDQWHQAAANANLDQYFSLMAPDAIYIGTDATENWTMPQFKAFCKPYFDRGTAWNFKALQRNIYFNAAHDMAWFDELLDTHMKICRGSGVLKKENGQWKIAHYVLSMTVPNEQIDAVIKVKAPAEDAYIKTLQQTKR